MSYGALLESWMPIRCVSRFDSRRSLLHKPHEDLIAEQASVFCEAEALTPVPSPNRRGEFYQPQLQQFIDFFSEYILHGLPEFLLEFFV